MAMTMFLINFAADSVVSLSKIRLSFPLLLTWIGLVMMHEVAPRDARHGFPLSTGESLTRVRRFGVAGCVWVACRHVHPQYRFVQ